MDSAVALTKKVAIIAVLALVALFAVKLAVGAFVGLVMTVFFIAVAVAVVAGVLWFMRR